MLEVLLGSTIKEKILLFIFCRNQGYAREISCFYDIPLTSVLKQLKKLEAGNVIYAEPQGKTVIYKFYPRYPFLTELKTLLEKAISFYPDDLVEKLQYNRRRPRRTGKPL
jgi:DNA-binding transcriptional ArsR family regulator